MNNQFSDNLLAAIGRWQEGWSEDQTRRRNYGKTLQSKCSGLDSYFRTAGRSCFRKRYIHKTEILDFLTGNLVEGPASWSDDLNCVERFKGNKLGPAHFCAIFVCTPTDSEVILNLNKLWGLTTFKDAVSCYTSRGGKHAGALNNFRDRQGEIVLHSTLNPNRIYALCGVSSDFDQLCEKETSMDEDEIDKAWSALENNGDEINTPRWIGQESSLRVMNNVLDKADSIFLRKLNE